ncbi:MAG TPA: hypothetical protein DCZ95_00475 [Verrucomicrobia bacterium]|nr:hypothetical protein [Verrucomicrobiota bacterium]
MLRRRTQERPRAYPLCPLLLAIAVWAACAGCATPSRITGWPPKTPGRVYVLEVTGYCACRSCCGWERNWRGQPVFASGPSKGKPKPVGLTASGTLARPGTIAADTRLFPFGTFIYIPGYGYGRVEDRGQKIQGYKIDLFFRSHAKALQWGRKQRAVKVWLPEKTIGKHRTTNIERRTSK